MKRAIDDATAVDAPSVDPEKPASEDTATTAAKKVKSSPEKPAGKSVEKERTMPRAWMMDTLDADQRLEHQCDPPEPVDLEYLKEHGVLYWKLDADNFKEEGKLDKIREERGYTYEDEVTLDHGKLPDYEAKIKMFFQEHIHRDEEIRFCTDGSGYFDFRDKNDRWVRIEFLKGDMIILPAGIYHRFTLDNKDYIKARRYFVGEPVWTPVNRPADDDKSRKAYVSTLKDGGFAA
ncbi:acireductone dioxygenase-like [Amphiura filiformis]|uniref:acireductone dioxygenase-like n=1 Tax=Amphiura filiformis TaxID=82378 RepID=UPI003B216F83